MPLSTISDRLFALRNRVLSDGGFQRWAARFPLTKRIARRRASALFDLCAGFVYSQVLLASVRLGLLEALASGPITTSALAPMLALSIPATQRLVDAAAALKLVEARSHGRYGLGIHGASLVGNRSVALMIEHHALLYTDLADPVALLRGELGATELERFWTYDEAAESEPYSALMAGSMELIAADVLEAYPHDRHQALLDVGGGDGAFLQAVASQSPHLSLALFELPNVAAIARRRFAHAGLSSRATVIAGNVLQDPLPDHADLVSLVRVVHDHDDAAARSILRAVHRALRPGGTLLLAEPMAGTPHAEAVGDAYFGFYLLAMRRGRPRTSDALRSLLAQAGFGHVELRETRRPMLTRLLVARR